MSARPVVCCEPVGLDQVSRWRRPDVTQQNPSTVRRDLQARLRQVQLIELNLTPVEIAVFGPNPDPETIEALRYRTERVLKQLAQLYPQPKRRQRQLRQSVPGGLLTAAQPPPGSVSPSSS
jgi:hypothetical protein